MARKKKYYGLMDENATKTSRISFRITPREAMEIGRLKYKTGMSTSDLYRKAMDEYVKQQKSNE